MFANLWRRRAGVLRNKKTAARETASQVNALKRTIDELKTQLDARQEVSAREGVLGRDGVVDEAEFSMLTRVGEAKTQYRAAFQSLQSLRSDIEYCDRLVGQCRMRLLADFELWFRETYGADSTMLFGPEVR